MELNIEFVLERLYNHTTNNLETIHNKSAFNCVRFFILPLREGALPAVDLLHGLGHHGQRDQGEAADGEAVGDLLEEEDLGDHGDDDGGGPVMCHVSRYVTSRDNRPVHQRHGPRLLQLEGEDAEADLAEAHHTCRGNSEGRAQ